MLPTPHRSTCFPYTTLFRSSALKMPESVLYDGGNKVLYVSNIEGTDPWGKDGQGSIGKVGVDGKIIKVDWVTGLNAPKGLRSEEHTSELQSLRHLVCRLLLE